MSHSNPFSSARFLGFQAFNDVHALEDAGRKNVTTSKPFEDSGEIFDLSDEETTKGDKKLQSNTTTRKVVTISKSPTKASDLSTKPLSESATTTKASSTTASSSTTAKNKAAHYPVASRILIVFFSMFIPTMIFFLY